MKFGLPLRPLPIPGHTDSNKSTWTMLLCQREPRDQTWPRKAGLQARCEEQVAGRALRRVVGGVRGPHRCTIPHRQPPLGPKRKAHCTRISTARGPGGPNCWNVAYAAENPRTLRAAHREGPEPGANGYHPAPSRPRLSQARRAPVTSRLAEGGRYHRRAPPPAPLRPGRRLTFPS